MCQTVEQQKNRAKESFMAAIKDKELAVGMAQPLLEQHFEANQETMKRMDRFSFENVFDRSGRVWRDVDFREKERIHINSQLALSKRQSADKKESDQIKDAKLRAGNVEYPIKEEDGVLAYEGSRELIQVQRHVDTRLMLLREDGFSMRPGANGMEGISPGDVARLHRFYLNISQSWGTVGMENANAFDLNAKAELVPLLGTLLKTWYEAHGINMDDGSKITSPFKKSKARKRLHLEIEKYRDAVSQFDFRRGEILFEQISGIKPMKEQILPHQIQDATASATERLGIDAPLLEDSIKEIEDLRNLVMEHPEQYMLMRDTINRILSEFTSACKTLDLRRIKMDSALKVIDAMDKPGTELNAEKSDLLKKLFETKDNDERLALTQIIESGKQAIKFLLTGEKVDFVNAAFVEKRWGICDSGNFIPQQFVSEAFSDKKLLKKVDELQKKLMEDREKLAGGVSSDEYKELTGKIEACEACLSDRDPLRAAAGALKLVDENAKREEAFKSKYGIGIYDYSLQRALKVNYPLEIAGSEPGLEDVFSTACNIHIMSEGKKYVPQKKTDMYGETKDILVSVDIPESERQAARIKAYREESPKIEKQVKAVEALFVKQYGFDVVDISDIGNHLGELISIYSASKNLQDIFTNVVWKTGVLEQLTEDELNKSKDMYTRVKSITMKIDGIVKAINDNAMKRMSEVSEESLDLLKGGKKSYYLAKAQDSAEAQLRDARRDMLGKGISETQYERDAKEKRAKEWEKKNAVAERTLLSPKALTSIPGYGALANNPKMIALLNRITDFQQKTGDIKIPAREGDVQKFINNVALMNGTIQTEMNKMIDDLANIGLDIAFDDPQFQPFVAFCQNQGIHMRDQIDLILRIQEKCMTLSRENPANAKIPYGKKLSEVLLDTEFASVYRERVDTPKVVLGQGAMNTVYMVKDTDTGTDRVFKAGQKEAHLGEPDTRTIEEVYERIQSRRLNGSKETIEMESAYRDLGVATINRLFDLAVCTETSFARNVEGNQSVLMDKVQGESGNGLRFYYGEKNEAMCRMKLQIDLYSDHLALSEDDKKQPGWKAEAVDKRKEVQTYKLVRLDTDEAFDSSMRLAVLDIIAGHVDRHGGNIMFDLTTGRMTAIDNDTAFKSSTKVGQSGQQPLSWDRILDFSKENGVYTQHGSQPILILEEVFPFVTKKLYENVTQMDPNVLKSSLQGKLSEAEIDAAVSRWQQLKDYLLTMPKDKIYDDISTVPVSAKESYMRAGTREEYRGSIYFNYMSQRLKTHDLGSWIFEEREPVEADERERIRKNLSSEEGKIYRRYIRDITNSKNFEELNGTAVFFAMEMREVFEKNPDADLFEMEEKGELVRMAQRAIDAWKKANA